MKIIVCAKQIRHTYTRTGKDPETNYISPEDAIFRVNPYDEAALELALRLKDGRADTEIVLLSIGPMIAESEIRRCLATGADHLFQINSQDQDDPQEPLNQPDPWVKSDLLYRAVKELEGDLILCGKQSQDKASGQVGALLAHRLKMPFVSAITNLSLENGYKDVRVQRSAGRGVREIIACRLPAVFSVDMGPDLRLPVFARRQWAEAYETRRLDYQTEQVGPRIVSTRRFQARPRPKIVPAPDSRLHAYDRILQLLSGSTVEKKGEILTGSPESQVQGIVSFLEANGFLEPEKTK